MQWTIAIRMKTIISSTGFYSLKTDILKKYILIYNANKYIKTRGGSAKMKKYVFTIKC